MYVLGIDTSTRVCSLAIVEKEEVIGELAVKPVLPHAPFLVPAVEQLLKWVGISVSCLGGIGVALGPGSFTGLKIGLATVKGLALVTGLPVAGVVTLDALARGGSWFKGLVCPLVPCRKNEVFAALYRSMENGLTRISDYSVLSLSELAGLGLKKNQSVLFLGEGAAIYRANLYSFFGRRAVFVDDVVGGRCGTWVALLAEQRFRQGCQDDISALQPLYLKPPPITVKKGG